MKSVISFLKPKKRMDYAMEDDAFSNIFTTQCLTKPLKCHFLKALL